MNNSLVTVWEHLLPLINDPTYCLSFGVLALILFVAQAINFLRIKSATGTETNRKVAIIISSWWKILGFCFFSFWGGAISIIPIFYLLTLFAILEYSRVSALAEMRVSLFAGSALGVTIHYLSFALKDPFLLFASLHIYILLVVMPYMIISKRLDILPELIAFLLSLVILAIFLSFPVAVIVFESEFIGSENAARLAVLMLIVLTEVNDILQFLCGKLFGKRKVIPWISPNKTEAGFVGGIILSSLLGAVIWPRLLPIAMPTGAALGFVLSIGGMVGDLVCSAVKRHRGVKDFSDLIPGHGGIIDRIDSLIVTAPIFFLFIHWLKG